MRLFQAKGTAWAKACVGERAYVLSLNIYEVPARYETLS